MKQDDALIQIDLVNSIKKSRNFFSVNINTVSDWIALYRKGGIESLLRFDYKGRPQKLNDEQILQLRNEASNGSFNCNINCIVSALTYTLKPETQLTFYLISKELISQ